MRHTEAAAELGLSRAVAGVMGGLVPLVCGCSFLFIKKPPAEPEKLRKDVAPICTSSRIAPVLDTAVAGFEIYRTAYAAGADDSAYQDFPISREDDIALGLTFMALFGASAIYGYVNTTRCSKLEDRYMYPQEAEEEEQETEEPPDEALPSKR
jgi:hypothetical protein